MRLCLVGIFELCCPCAHFPAWAGWKVTVQVINVKENWFLINLPNIIMPQRCSKYYWLNNYFVRKKHFYKSVTKMRVRLGIAWKHWPFGLKACDVKKAFTITMVDLNHSVIKMKAWGLHKWCCLNCIHFNSFCCLGWTCEDYTGATASQQV